MKVLKPFLLALLPLLIAGLAVAMHHEPTAEKGKALFNDVKLGSSGQSCASCHPDGKGVEGAAMKPDLAKIVNKCIKGSLKGTPLDEKSNEMQSLVLYLQSLHKM